MGESQKEMGVGQLGVERQRLPDRRDRFRESPLKLIDQPQLGMEGREPGLDRQRCPVGLLGGAPVAALLGASGTLEMFLNRWRQLDGCPRRLHPQQGQKQETVKRHLSGDPQAGGGIFGRY